MAIVTYKSDGRSRHHLSSAPDPWTGRPGTTVQQSGRISVKLQLSGKCQPIIPRDGSLRRSWWPTRRRLIKGTE
jgi:hypothetical protein